MVRIPEAGWEPTPGCKACDEERSGVKRRGRPFKHTAECAAKQSDFRERLREMKVLSADEGTPALDPGSGAVPAWPVVSETAGASSSSSGIGGIIAQPMAVESDLSHTRGLKRGLAVADIEIAEVCSSISDVNVNEEPHPPVPEMEFTDEEEWLALSAELARLDEFEAKKDIPQDQATGPLLTFKWVRTVKKRYAKLQTLPSSFW